MISSKLTWHMVDLQSILLPLFKCYTRCRKTEGQTFFLLSCSLGLNRAVIRPLYGKWANQKIEKHLERISCQVHILGFLNSHMLSSVHAVCGQAFQKAAAPLMPMGAAWWPLPCLTARRHKSFGAAPVFHTEAQVSYGLCVIWLRSQFPSVSS